jgi:acyl-CoA thioesterase
MKKGPAAGNAPGSLRDRIESFDECEFARHLGIRIMAARYGYARLAMPAADKKNPHQTIHGGAVFTLADHAFGIAANAGSDRWVAVTASIRYLAPASGDLEAVAEYVGGSRNFSAYRVTVTDNGKPVALFDGTAARIVP